MRDNCPQSRSSAVLVSIGSIRAASLFFMRHVHNKAALKQYPTARMLTYQVSTRVNSPKNNDAALIDPIDTSTADDRDCGQLSLIR